MVFVLPFEDKRALRYLGSRLRHWRLVQLACASVGTILGGMLFSHLNRPLPNCCFSFSPGWARLLHVYSSPPVCA